MRYIIFNKFEVDFKSNGSKISFKNVIAYFLIGLFSFWTIFCWKNKMNPYFQHDWQRDDWGTFLSLPMFITRIFSIIGFILWSVYFLVTWFNRRSNGD